jgi:hypothetical protein
MIELCFNIKDTLPYLQALSFLAAAVSLVYAAITYYKNNKVKRGEWLKTLFEKFFEENKFSEVRMHIEYDTLEAYLNTDETKEPKNKINEELMVNYLNFFEFISILNIKRYISDEEVKLMFRHYIKKIGENKYLQEVDYINKYDFENLQKLLSKKL